MFKKIVSKKGFTLIELLVVIVIISILATLLTANFIGVRQRGRDAERKSDLRQIQAALEIFRTDNGCYPNTASGGCGGVTTIPPCNSPFVSGANTYMKKIPCEPLGSGFYNGGNYYYSSTDGTTYTLGACLENVSDNDLNDSTTNPGGSAGTCTSVTGVKYIVLSNP